MSRLCCDLRFALFYDDGEGKKPDEQVDDDDFDDMVVTVTQVAAIAVPEPASLALFGAALAALGLARRRIPRA